jgi:hypothetical protein
MYLVGGGATKEKTERNIERKKEIPAAIYF